MCTEAALSAKEKDTLEIWRNNFERILSNDYIMVLGYMCIGMKPNRCSWNHLRSSTFDGPVCLQVYFHLRILTMRRINVFRKWFVNVLKYCIYSRELSTLSYFIPLMASLLYIENVHCPLLLYFMLRYSWVIKWGTGSCFFSFSCSVLSFCVLYKAWFFMLLEN